MISKRGRFELMFWSAVPALITLLLAILCMIPKPFPGFSAFMPILPLIPIFYWGLLQANEMPYWFVCFIGVLSDAATGQPLGLSALLYLFFLTTLHAQRKHIIKEGFMIRWSGFALMVIALCALQWLFFSIFANRVYTFFPAILQWLLTVCCYPIFHKAFDTLAEHIHMRRWKLIHA